MARGMGVDSIRRIGYAIFENRALRRKGDPFEIDTFTFDPMEGTAIRLYGIPGGNPSFFSIGQIQVCGTDA